RKYPKNQKMSKLLCYVCIGRQKYSKELGLGGLLDFLLHGLHISLCLLHMTVESCNGAFVLLLFCFYLCHLCLGLLKLPLCSGEVTFYILELILLTFNFALFGLVLALHAFKLC